MSDSDFTIPISQAKDLSSERNTEYGYKTLKSGDLLSQRFLIVKELGSGGFATTYLAIDQNFEQETKCAVKQLQPRFNTSAVWENAKERLATEAMVLQWLGKHDQIPQFVGHFEENKQFYLVLEFIEGEEFEPEVNRQTLNEAQGIEFLIDILSILQFVHEQGVIHRDIKPSNLIRRRQDGKMILIDFGAVKEIGTLAFDTSRQQLKTQIIGTPGYMSPEQNNGKPVYSSDIYALGKTLIFGMTGKSPMEWSDFEGDDLAWNKKIVVSEAFLRIINRMTAENSSERYPGALEVLQDLQPLRLIGQTIGDKYQIVKYLGGNQEINSFVASTMEENPERYYLEIIQPQNLENLTLAEANQEIMIGFSNLAAIDNHDRIPQVIEYFIDEARIYIFQEFVEGESLAQIIDDQFILSEAEVVNVIVSAASALSPFHKQQIVHGNIKPSSLIKRQKEGVALVDFNLVKEITNVSPDLKTGYVSPEQIAGRATPASDIYALGMTAIHILTGTRPQNLEKNPHTGEILWHRKARISPSFAKVLDKMICLDPNQRYQSVNRVAKDLKKIKNKSKFRGLYKYLLIAPVLVLGLFIGLAQWSQRAAILEFYRGDSKLDAKKYREAVEYYDSGLNRLPNTRGQVRNFEQVWLKKAKAQRQLGEYKNALNTCSTALKRYQSPQLWNCKALTLYNLERYDAAIAAYNQAINIAPENVWLWNNRGEAYTRLKQKDKAVFDFQKAIELDPARSFVSWNNLGKLYYQEGEYQAAIKSYEQALETKPDYLPALIGLGNVQKSNRQYTQALESYERALVINSEYHEAWFGKGSVAEYLGKHQSAQEYYQTAAKLKPDWQAASQALERVENRLGVRNR